MGTQEGVCSSFSEVASPPLVGENLRIALSPSGSYQLTDYASGSTERVGGLSGLARTRLPIPDFISRIECIADILVNASGIQITNYGPIRRRPVRLDTDSEKVTICFGSISVKMPLDAG